MQTSPSRHDALFNLLSRVQETDQAPHVCAPDPLGLEAFKAHAIMSLAPGGPRLN